AATPEWRFVRAMRKLISAHSRSTLGIRTPGGQVRSVEPMAVNSDGLSAFGSAPSVREAGRLGELGAPDIAYINHATEVLKDLNTFKQAVADAAGAQGLVLDMRGYPGGVNPRFTLPHLVSEPIQSPLFRIPTWRGPDLGGVDESQSSLPPNPSPSFLGPIVLLVGPAAVSASENTSMMLVGAQRVRVVGRRTAGTNGNITRLRLQGGIWFMYTGMEVLYPDRSPFHGIGIVPEVEVNPTVEDFAAGRDPELLKAIELLRAGG
ncbi:S41 family peptidase, partial [Hyalangium sp.]|uniref:S41 family peptidase n=1 Tax=Hyalangium sp. TaxID=2028555 RepID=UPI002D268C66